MIISLIKKLFKIDDFDYKTAYYSLNERLDKAIQKIHYQQKQINGLNKTEIELKDRLNFELQHSLDQSRTIQRYKFAFKNFIKFHKKKTKLSFEEVCKSGALKFDYLCKIEMLKDSFQHQLNLEREYNHILLKVLSETVSQLKKSNRTKNQLRKKIAELERKV